MNTRIVFATAVLLTAPGCGLLNILVINSKSGPPIRFDGPQTTAPVISPTDARAEPSGASNSAEAP
jgi:hypothetical protein